MHENTIAGLERHHAALSLGWHEGLDVHAAASAVAALLADEPARAELAGRGARVLGVDGNAELVAAAQGRGIAGARFLTADLRELERELEAPVDGIWCSFAAAYFVDLERVLAAWRELLVPGGWIALTEVDDMFAHGPVRARTAELYTTFLNWFGADDTSFGNPAYCDGPVTV